jgi:rRNA maturation endonuclease Nob1
VLANQLAMGARFYVIGDFELRVLAMGYNANDKVKVSVAENPWGITSIDFAAGAEVTGVRELETMECHNCWGKGFRRSGDKNVCNSCGRIKQ